MSNNYTLQHLLQEKVFEKLKGFNESNWLSIIDRDVKKNIAFYREIFQDDLKTKNEDERKNAIEVQQIKYHKSSRYSEYITSISEPSIQCQQSVFLVGTERNINNFLNKDFAKKDPKESPTLEYFSFFLSFDGWKNAIFCEFDIGLSGIDIDKKKQYEIKKGDLKVIEQEKYKGKTSILKEENNIYQGELHSLDVEKRKKEVIHFDTLNSKKIKTSFENFKKALSQEILPKKINKVIQYLTWNKFVNLLNTHLKEVEGWSKEISLNGLVEVVEVGEVYTGLDYYTKPRNNTFEIEELETNSLLDLILDYNLSSTILLGQPGSGKTMTLKYVCNLFLTETSSLNERFEFPLCIRFRDLEPTSIKKPKKRGIPLISDLLRIVGLGDNSRKINEIILKIFLREFNILLILDGFDEYRCNDKFDKIKEINLISKINLNSRFLLASRPVEFDYHIINTNKIEITPLSPEQVEAITLNWLDEESAKDFLSLLEGATYKDSAKRPLFLIHLLIIYKGSEKIPNRPVLVYSKVVDLLLQKWDKERAIKRNTKYSKFTVFKKKKLLTYLSYYLNKNMWKQVFHRSEVESVFEKICSSVGLSMSEFELVLNELEGHSGLILKRRENSYEFAHLSIQEYFVANFMKRKGLEESITYSDALKIFPNALAVYVAMLDDPNEVFYKILMVNGNDLFEEKLIFLDRIYLENPLFKVAVELGDSILSFFDFCLIKKEIRSRKSNLSIVSKIIETPVFKRSIAILEQYYYVGGVVNLKKDKIGLDIHKTKERFLKLNPKMIKTSKGKSSFVGEGILPSRDVIRIRSSFISNWEYSLNKK